MPKTAADVDEHFVHDSADDGSTSDSPSEEDDSEAPADAWQVAASVCHREWHYHGARIMGS